jgi:hypothetical protein
MTHEFSGHYAAKHPAGTELDSRIADAVRAKGGDGTLSCAAAHRIATDVGIHPSEVGKTMDLMEFRIVKCQLGLFGYSPSKKIVEPADSVPLELADALKAALVDDRLPCKSAWRIAERFGITRMAAAAACEKMNLRVSPCQLGAF